MSWSVSMIGKPENVVARLEAESAKQSGQSKEEYDAAKPHLIGLVQQNFGGSYPRAIYLSASGSGFGTSGAGAYRSCNVKIEDAGVIV